MTSSATDKYGLYYKLMAALADLALLNLAGYIGYIITYSHHEIQFNHHINLVQILLINFIWFNVTQLSKLYDNPFVKDAIPTIKQSLSSVFFFVLLMYGLEFFVTEFNMPHKLSLYTLVVFIPFFLTGKVVFLLLRRTHRAKLIKYKRVVIVGAGPVGLELKTIMESKSSMGFRVVGFFDDQPELVTEDVYIIGGTDECIDYVKNYHINEIYCALPDRAIDKINRLMRHADQEMIRLKLVPDVKDYFKKNVNISMLGHFPVISPRIEPLEVLTNKLLKRIFDIVFSLLVILFLMSWLFPLIALLIKLESKGPILFKQLRSGKDNKPFACLKFRSMYVNGDADMLQAKKNDNRITRIGAFIRKTSIDELPQFFNVLKGQMSVVGPRPHMLQHTEQYSAIIDQYMVRHFLLPGITGWAQVNGHRGETNDDSAMENRVEADIWYMENWSLLLDLKIAFLTVWQVVSGDDNVF